MPATASTETKTRSAPSSRPSATLRPRAAEPIAPVLLRFPVIQQLGDLVATKSTSPTEIVASTVALDPPVAVAPVTVQASATLPTSPSQPVATSAEKSTENATQKRSWWEHWSSGLVLMLLLLVLIAAALVVFSDSRNETSDMLATETNPSARGKSADEGIGSLLSIEVPEITLGTPVDSSTSSQTVAITPNEKVEAKVSANSPATPFAQVSARVPSDEPKAEASQAAKNSSEVKPESNSASQIHFGLPAPMDSTSSKTPAPNAPAATELTQSPPAPIQESGVSSLLLSSAPAASAEPLPQSNVAPKLPDLLATPQAGSQMVPANLAGYTSPSPNAVTAKPVVSSEPSTNLPPAPRANVAVSTASTADPAIQSEKPVVKTATPDANIDQLMRQWQEFKRLRDAGSQTDTSNRYSPSSGSATAPVNIAPPQSVSSPVR